MRFNKIPWHGSALYAAEGYKLMPHVDEGPNRTVVITWTPWYEGTPIGEPTTKQHAKQICREHYKEVSK